MAPAETDLSSVFNVGEHESQRKASILSTKSKKNVSCSETKILDLLSGLLSRTSQRSATEILLVDTVLVGVLVLTVVVDPATS